VQVGISIPLWFKPHTSQIQSAKLHAQAAELDYQQLQKQLQADFITSYQAYQKLARSNQYYLSTALPQAELILNQSNLGFKEGEITYLEYINGLSQSMDIQFRYLDNLNQLNQAIISIEYLLGNN
jgi:cobalt-zinc-cadmium resistance protein CzcA